MRAISGPAYFRENECTLDDFIECVSRSATLEDFPQASRVEKNIPVYDIGKLGGTFINPEKRKDLMAEWAAILLTGPGVMVLSNTYSDTTVIDRATEIYNEIIAEEKRTRGSAADHFAKAGANDRIWNSLQKLCLASPEVFAEYFGNIAIDAMCEAWLGPHYQMTAQINLVRPGGEAQLAHRDYHLGFQTADISARFPAHVHDLNPVLTLQGGIAHVDIPIESGPTKLLPFSQTYRPGYAAWRRDDFRAYFEDHFVQLPLKKGDALFFSPALFHAGGSNHTTDIQRMVNLLQVSSAFGVAMETIDHLAMSKALFAVLKAKTVSGGLNKLQIDAAISCCAAGYSFPTNLDNDPPVGGLAPVTQQAILLKAVKENWSQQRLELELDKLVERQRA